MNFLLGDLLHIHIAPTKFGAGDPAEHTSGRFSLQHLHCRPSADGTFKVLAIPEVSLSAGLSAHKQSGPNMHLRLGRDK